MKNIDLTKLEERVLFVFNIFLLIFLFKGIVFTHPNNNQPFEMLAKAFLQGKLHLFTDNFSDNYLDLSFFKGNYYLPHGVFPAILSIPLVLLFNILNIHSPTEIYLLILLTSLNFILCYKLARQFNISATSSLWLSIAYIFASPYLYINFWSIPSYFPHAVVTSLLLGSLYEFQTRKRWILIGVLVSLSFMTRATTIFGIVFFCLHILLKEEKKKERFSQLIKLLFPLFCSIVTLSLYNYLRFENPLESGYSFAIVDLLWKNNQSYGLWSFIHFPANLYYLFLKSPDPIFIPNTRVMTYPYLQYDLWGQSIFFTSPFFLWIAKAPFNNKTIISALISIFFILFSILGFYGIGAWQFGYRYALDFYPFLYFILLFSVDKNISILLKIIIAVSLILKFLMMPSSAIMSIK